MRRNKPEILIRPSLLFLLLLLLSVQLVRDDDLPVAVAASARPAWHGEEEGFTFSRSEPTWDWISHCQGEPTSNLSTSSNSTA